ncbi:cell division protein ZapE [Wenzhouxiangella sp. AB-CW3]|uniref:cell division protein ZapE n=1 Tax=Wenzhouxiangella sp. AB-CW3 TaxID=2771012 RepID=UPI00168B85A4|nr:cell division protein ZapE [Wenzhouxiangella sp. AB-CW3]QOC22207.1 cell division protein ZapE [Wenzhouxiangella sp. AB-CW3]
MNGGDASGPLPRYRKLCEREQLKADPAQRQIVEALQATFERLGNKRASLVERWQKRYPAVPGIYLHGQVGRGKTMLMDLLAESLAESGIPVERIHFHRFMDQTHERLKHLREKGEPLVRLGREIAARTRVLCFDEFHVGDIGDAMILAGLLETLFERGVTLVATSNAAPDDLYAGGLQRERFVPAIEAIKAHCDVICLDSREDYRLRELVRHPTYLHPADEAARRELAGEFEALAAGERVSTAPLDIRGRELQPLRRAGSVVWFDFATLCQGPRASADYIELCKRFGTLIVSDVAQMQENDNNTARRFIHLVDECYDRSVKLIVSAAVAPTELYTGSKLTAPFERTVSRLIEMQSRDYLALPHRP